MISPVSISPGGPTVSEIVLGTWRLLDHEPLPSNADLVSRLELCLELGITTIDTAEIYGLYTVEAALGAVFKEKPGLRDQFQLISKCGIEVPSGEKPSVETVHYNASSVHLTHCTEKSLRLLNTDRLDILLVHRPDWLTSADDTAQGLDQLLADGKILHAGVSNYNPAQFELLNDRVAQPLVTNQIEFSLLHRAPLDDGSLAQCEKHRVRPMAWSPLGGGALFDPDNAVAVRIRQCLEGMRHKYDGARDDALAFAWVMAHPSRPIPILGSKRAERIRSTSKAAAINLQHEDWYALWQAAQGHPVP